LSQLSSAQHEREVVSSREVVRTNAYRRAWARCEWRGGAEGQQLTVDGVHALSRAVTDGAV